MTFCPLYLATCSFCTLTVRPMRATRPAGQPWVFARCAQVQRPGGGDKGSSIRRHSQLGSRRAPTRRRGRPPRASDFGSTLIVHPFVFGVACAEPIGSSKQQVGTTRTNGENDDKNVDRMSTSSRCWNHTLKEGTNLGRCRSDDLPKTFTFLEFSFAKRILR